MSSLNEHRATTPADLIAELAGCRITQIRQEGSSIIVEVDDADGSLHLIGEAEGSIKEILSLNQLPPWHDGRLIAWADMASECLVVALKSGNQFSLRAQSLRVERGV
jgi:hypothetical protein